MVRIAVSGGTGGLGRTLVEELMLGNEHEIFVFSRKPTLSFPVSANVHCLQTSYDSVESLTDLFKSNNIHTVISTLNPPTPEVHAAEINLIKAASQSGTVKRFAPSEWGIDYSAPDDQLPLPWKTFKRKAAAELKVHPHLESTQFYPGYFLDYWGLPHAPTHMMPEVPFIDVGNAKAAIPASGDETVVFTYTKDVARFVRKAVESEEKWPEKSIIVGDRFTLNDVVSVAEKVRGKKFDVVHDSLDDLRAGKVTELPAYLATYEIYPREFFLEMTAGFGVAMATGVFDLNSDNSLNKRYPDIQPIKMVDFLEKYRAGK